MTPDWYIFNQDRIEQDTAFQSRDFTQEEIDTLDNTGMSSQQWERLFQSGKRTGPLWL